MPVPDFSPGEVLTAADMDAVGLWKITSGTFSTNTEVNIDAITSSFTNYKLVVNWYSSTTMYLGMRTRLSGSTDQTANYSQVEGTGAQSIDQTFWRVGYNYTSQVNETRQVIDIFDPYSTSTATSISTIQSGRNGNTGAFAMLYMGYKEAAARVDGIQLLPAASGTITGKYVLYGYRD